MFHIGHKISPPGSLNVKAYGAKGDGATDDTAAIQTTITALPTNGGIIYLPPGNYRLTAGIVISESGVSFVGAGKSATTISYDAISGSAISTSGGQRVYLLFRDFSLRDVYELPQKPYPVELWGGDTTIGIDFSSVAISRIEEVSIQDFHTQLLIDGAGAGTHYNVFEHLHIYAARPDHLHRGNGIVLRNGANDNTFRSIIFYDLARQFVCDGTIPPNQTSLEACSFESAAVTAIDLVKALGIKIGGVCRFEGNAIGVRFTETSDVSGVVIDASWWEGNTVNIQGGVPLMIQRAGANKVIEQSAGLTTQPSPNLIPDGSIEGWTDTTHPQAFTSILTTDWDYTVASQIMQEGTVKRTSGDFSAKVGDFAGGGAAPNGGIATPKIPIDPLRSYTLSFWAGSTDAAHVGEVIALRIFDVNGDEIVAGSAIQGIGTDESVGSSGPSYMLWDTDFLCYIQGATQKPAVSNVLQKQTVVFRFPATAAWVQIGIIEFTEPTFPGYVFVDEMRFCEGAAPFTFHPKPIGDSGDQRLYGDLQVNALVAAGPQVNVKAFGAKGDGVSDDTAAIQAAINGVYGTNDPYGTTPAKNHPAIYFPPGKYRTTAPIRISTRGANLIGDTHNITGGPEEGWGGKIVSDHAGNCIELDADYDVCNFCMSGIQCMPAVAHNGQGHGLDVEGANYVFGLMIKDCLFKSFNDGIHIIPQNVSNGTTSMADLVIENCMVNANYG